MKLTLQHNTIRALLTVAAKDDIRYYLNGVAIDATASGDVVLVATNGHVLLAVPMSVNDIEDLRPGSFIIPRQALESVKPVKAGRTVLPITLEITVPNPEPDPQRPGVTIQKPTQFAVTGATTATGTVVDGIYPDWRRVMPASASGETAQFNPALVARMGDAAQLLGGKPEYMVIHHNGAGGALVSGLANGALGVVMPLRCDDMKHPGLPAWARKV